MNTIIILVAKYAIYLMGAGWLVFWVVQSRQQKIRLAVVTITAGIVALISAKIAGHLWYDPRPFVVGHVIPLIAHANNNGFPSDHTLLAGVLAFSMLTVSRKWGMVATMAALAIGTSRVLARVHHPADIIASLLIAAAAIWLGARVWNFRDHKTHQFRAS